MTTDQLYLAFLAKFDNNPEKALKLLIYNSINQYTDLITENGHPVLVIVAAAMELNWEIAIKNEGTHVDGMAIGTEAYLNELFPPEIPEFVKANKFCFYEGKYWYKMMECERLDASDDLIPEPCTWEEDINDYPVGTYVVWKSKKHYWIVGKTITGPIKLKVCVE